MFRIPVKMEKLQKRQRSAGLLHMLSGFFLLVTGSFSENGFFINPVILIIAVVSFIYGVFRKKIDPPARYNHWLRLIQAAAFLFKALSFINTDGLVTMISLLIWAAVTIMLFFTERKMLRPSELVLANDGITVPGEFKDHLIPWSLVNGVVLRPDYLTITREDSSFAQLEVTKDLASSFIEAANTFASEKIAANQNTASNDQ